MPSWPASLPQRLMLPVTVTPRSAVVRTEMDVGPPKQRLRSTLVWKDVVGHMVLTGAQKAAFDAWWQNDIAQGALAFTWVDPTDNEPAQLRFVTEEPPEWSLIVPGIVLADRRWAAVLQLEIVPS